MVGGYGLRLCNREYVFGCTVFRYRLLCWINQLGTTCDDPEVREFITVLGVPVSHKVYGCVALGYGDPKIPMKEKKVKADTVTIVK